MLHISSYCLALLQNGATTTAMHCFAKGSIKSKKFKLVVCACYGAYFLVHVFKYLVPKFVSA